MIGLRQFSNRLPFPFKRGLKYFHGILPPRLRYGKIFWETYNFLKKSQWWSQEKLLDYQMGQLSKLLKHAYDNVPHYRKIFNERDFKPKNIQCVDDLKKLPYLDKDTFKANFDDMIARIYKCDSLPTGHTGGTTGKPLQFYEDPTTFQKELAFIFHQWSRVGYSPGEPRVVLRGIINREKPIYYNPRQKFLKFYPITDSKERVKYYIERMKSFGAEFLHCYPGAVTSFALAIKKYGISVPFKLKAVFFASEPVYKWQREIVREVFNCKLLSHYGLGEKVVLAAECENSRSYHCMPQYGITEFDPYSNEIIGTGFINYANPFIRYRTTDIATKQVYLGCKYCGRNYYPIFERVEGRIGDLIITPEGVMISPASLTLPFMDLKTIKNAQIVQNSLNKVIINVEKWDKSDEKEFEREVEQLCKDLSDFFGGNINVSWNLMDKVKRTKSGKFKWVHSNVSKEFIKEQKSKY